MSDPRRFTDESATEDDWKDSSWAEQWRQTLLQACEELGSQPGYDPRDLDSLLRDWSVQLLIRYRFDVIKTIRHIFRTASPEDEMRTFQAVLDGLPHQAYGLARSPHRILRELLIRTTIDTTLKEVQHG